MENSILVDDLIDIIYAHHKKVNNYDVEHNYEAKHMSNLKNKSFDRKVKWVEDMLSKAPKCFPLDMEYIVALNTWVSDMKGGFDSRYEIDAWQYAGYMWQNAIDDRKW